MNTTQLNVDREGTIEIVSNLREENVNADDLAGYLLELTILMCLSQTANLHLYNG